MAIWIGRKATGRLLAALLLTLVFPVTCLAFSAPTLITHKMVQSGEVTAYIPQINGLADKSVETKLNGMITGDTEQAAKQFQKDWDEVKKDAKLPEESKKHGGYWASYAVKFNKNDILSLTVQEYTFTGGAHGNTFTRAYNMNLKDGKVYRLPDLFKPGADYQERLNQLIRADIAAREAHYHFKGISDNQDFYFTEEGLVIYFQPYEIASWAEGYIRFVIPYFRIADLLDRSVPVY